MSALNGTRRRETREEKSETRGQQRDTRSDSRWLEMPFHRIPSFLGVNGVRVCAYVITFLLSLLLLLLQAVRWGTESIKLNLRFSRYTEFWEIKFLSSQGKERWCET